MFVNDTANKGLTPQIYKQLIQLNINPPPKKKQSKYGRKPKEIFLQRRHRWLTVTWKDAQYR